MNISERLFQAWKNGDKDAMKVIWELLWDRLYSYAIKRCGENKAQASYAFNTAFLEISEKIGQPDFFDWQGEEKFYGYIKKRIIWRCKQIQQEQNSRTTTSLYDCLSMKDETPNVENEIIAMEDERCFLNQFWGVYETLPKAMKEVIEAGLIVIREGETKGEYLKRKDILSRLQARLGITKKALDLRNKRLRERFNSPKLSRACLYSRRRSQ